MQMAGMGPGQAMNAPMTPKQANDLVLPTSNGQQGYTSPSGGMGWLDQILGKKDPWSGNNFMKHDLLT